MLAWSLKEIQPQFARIPGLTALAEPSRRVNMFFAMFMRETPTKSSRGCLPIAVRGHCLRFPGAKPLFASSSSYSCFEALRESEIRHSPEHQVSERCEALHIGKSRVDLRRYKPCFDGQHQIHGGVRWLGAAARRWWNLSCLHLRSRVFGSRGASSATIKQPKRARWRSSCSVWQRLSIFAAVLVSIFTKSGLVMHL
jgi:hypothetical protein